MARIDRTSQPAINLEPKRTELAPRPSQPQFAEQPPAPDSAFGDLKEKKVSLSGVGKVKPLEVPDYLKGFQPMNALQVKASQANAASIKSKDPKAIAEALKGMAPAEARKAIQAMPKQTLDGLKELMRTDADVRKQPYAVAIAVEMAARTTWGKDNPKVVADLRKAFDENRIVAGEKVGMGSTIGNSIKFKEELLQSPEALAATLAHEGTHVHQGSNCCGGEGAASPAGEVEGVRAGAAVWKQLRETRGANPEHVGQLDRDVEAAGKGGKALDVRVYDLYIKFAEQTKAARETERAQNPNAYEQRLVEDTVLAWDKKIDAFKKAKAKL